MSASFDIDGVCILHREQKLGDGGVFDVFTIVMPLESGGKPVNQDIWLAQQMKPDSPQVKVKETLFANIGKHVRVEGELQQQNGGSLYKLKALYCEPVGAAKKQAPAA